jgi:hypothetical protein
MSRTNSTDRDDRLIEASLRTLAREDAQVAVPPHLEAEVMRAWDRHAAQPPRRAWRGLSTPLAWRLAAVAVAVAISAVYIWLPARRADGPPTVLPDAVGALAPEQPGGPGGLSVMRVRMSRSAFASLGFPILEPDAAGVVDVEVIVGEDGVAQSIRRAAFAETHVIEE